MNKITVVCHKDHEKGYEDYAGKCLLCEVEALRQVLAQPEQEPVAYVTVNGMVANFVLESKGLNIPEKTPTPLYTALLKREWVGLTDEQIYEHEWWDEETAYAVNKFLMEKNT